jgi:Bacterial Ig domain
VIHAILYAPELSMKTIIESRHVVSALLGAVSLLSASLSQAQIGPIHEYKFLGNLNDSVGSVALVPNAGTVGPTSYAFQQNQGLSFTPNAASTFNPAEYSIEMVFSFNTTSGYRKIIDFADLSQDTGLHVLSRNLNFYGTSPAQTGTGLPFVDFGPARVILTRAAATGEMVGYVNGQPKITFIDGTGKGVFNQPSKIVNFFRDNGDGGETSVGAVSLIRIYATAMSATQAAALGSAPVITPPPPPVDKTKPTFNVTSVVPKVTKRSKVTISGNASDNVGVTKVRYRVNKGKFVNASGTTNWRFTANLKKGKNLLTIVVTDSSGNSLSRTLSVRRK